MMLPGIISGLIAMGIAAVTKTVVTVVIFFAALSRRMNAVKWAAAGFLLDFRAVLFFVITLLRLKLKKCKLCGAYLALGIKPFGAFASDGFLFMFLL